MALGGGNWIGQNKILPGAYINFVNAARAASILSNRGIGAIPLELDWGPDKEVFDVSVDKLYDKSVMFFGYSYKDDNLKGIRDIFKNASLCYFYKLNSGGNKAQNTYATARYSGVRGNDLKIVIENSIDVGKFDVYTYLDTVLVDSQTVVGSADLKANDFVEFKSSTLVITAGTPLSGGTNGTVTNQSYQDFFDKIESYSFNTIASVSSDDTVKGMFAEFTRRLRDSMGVKFQCVLHRYSNADYEGVISVENNSDTGLVYWVLGAEAGCLVNKSNTNKTYDGEIDIDVNYTQSQLESALKAGKFIFHKVGKEVRVLEDINTLVTYNESKNDDFSSNQIIRVLDQIGNDIAVLFNDYYLGKVQNNDTGRARLWGKIVEHHKELQNLGALENFNAEDVKVEQGELKKSVLVTDNITPMTAMTQLYMTVIIN